jgi:hypothetical protein
MRRLNEIFCTVLILRLSAPGKIRYSLYNIGTLYNKVNSRAIPIIRRIRFGIWAPFFAAQKNRAFRGFRPAAFAAGPLRAPPIPGAWAAKRFAAKTPLTNKKGYPADTPLRY